MLLVGGILFGCRGMSVGVICISAATVGMICVSAATSCKEAELPGTIVGRISSSD